MPKRNRAINTRHIKRDATYNIEEVAELLGVHVNTVRNWLTEDLSAIDDRRPILIHGAELINFLNRKRILKKKPCSPSQLYCFKCREPRRPKDKVITIEKQNDRVLRLFAICETCGTRMFKAGSPKLMSVYLDNFLLQPMPVTHIGACESAVVNCDLEKEEIS